jgi:hypothetical protein
MKIIVPTIRTTRVGYIHKFGADIVFDCPDRANVYNDTVITPLYETLIVGLTVFDRDLRIAQRAVGFTQLVFFTLTATLMVPVIVIGVTATVIDRGTRRLAASVSDLCDRLGLPGVGVRDTFVQLFRRVFT